MSVMLKNPKNDLNTVSNRINVRFVEQSNG